MLQGLAALRAGVHLLAEGALRQLNSSELLVAARQRVNVDHSLLDCQINILARILVLEVVVFKACTLLAGTYVAVTESREVSEMLPLLWFLLWIRKGLWIDRDDGVRGLLSGLLNVLSLHELLLDVQDVLVHVVLSLHGLVFVQICVVVRRY